MLENKIVLDSAWSAPELFLDEQEQEERISGYESPDGVFVEEEVAFEYALNQCLRGTEKDQQEFKDMLIEWFYQFWEKIEKGES